MAAITAVIAVSAVFATIPIITMTLHVASRDCSRRSIGASEQRRLSQEIARLPGKLGIRGRRPIANIVGMTVWATPAGGTEQEFPQPLPQYGEETGCEAPA